MSGIRSSLFTIFSSAEWNRRKLPGLFSMEKKWTCHFHLLFLFSIFMMQDFSACAGTGNYYGDTIYFSGFPWVVKESSGVQTGPGLNYFSGSQENIRIDQQGRMHLRLTMRNEKWYCPEVRLLQNLGYGQYIFHIDRMTDPLDKDVVIGLFVYDHTDPKNSHKEVDIEFSKWGKDTVLNTQYVVQPNEDQAHRFQTDLSRRTKHIMEIHKRKILFNSTYENGLNRDSTDTKIANWVYKPDKAYRPDKETISMNIWLYKASEPFNLKEMEVIISKFEFIPGK